MPWASHLKGPLFSANSVKILTNSSPTIFLFCSGSVIPSNFSRNLFFALMAVKFTAKLSLNIFSISCSSFNLSNPLSTNTHLSLFPMARCINRAATVESIPPLTPHKTLPSKLEISLTVFSTKPSIVHSCFAPQISRTKFLRIFTPFSV